MNVGRRARVTTSYKPVLDDELTLEVGDIITNIVDVDVGWCEGELNGKKGMFPNNFVELYTELIPRASEEVVVPQPTTTTSASNAGKKAKVMFEYEAQDDDELTLHVGDVIDVICDVGDGWWRGNLNGTIGILPSNFVELVDDKDVGQAKDKHAGIQKEAVPPEKKASGGRMGFGDLIIRAEKRLKSAESRPALSVPSSPPTVQAVNLRRQLREMEQQLREKDEQEENLQRQLREMKRQMREKDEQEENFKRQLREMEQQLTNFLDQYEEKENEMVNLQEQITTQKRELWEKDQQVNELEITLSTAQKALSKQVTLDWVISRDEIELTGKLLGKGGWGNVVEGKYCGCAVAVKQIHELILSPHNRNLFEREMDIASRCRHPCLLQFIGATNDEASPLFVTELMESSLRALLAQRPLAAREISIISLDVARALNYLHQKKPSPIIHRDISSANVLLWRQRNQWRGKVSYYGTANFLQHTMTVAPGAMIYMAPEACTPNQTIKVDLYSFGVLLCEMCLRELPDPEKRKQQIAMVTNSPLRGLIQGCVQLEPAARPNMEEIIKKLEPSK